MKKVLKAIVVLFLLLILVLIGMIVINKGFEKEKSFIVQLNGNQLETESHFIFNKKEKQTFTIIGEEGEEFTYKITPNKNSPFTFYMDDVIVFSNNINDFTKDFDINKSENSFVISFGDNFSMQSLLEKKYYASEIILGEDFDASECHFTLTISSTTRDAKYIVNFGVEFSASGVVLDKTLIIF